jgi:broad specificity phosphatase PhoE
MNTRIFLIRHGATTLTAEDRFAGATDVPLSDAGREQVRRLAERLRDDRLTAVYPSPLWQGGLSLIRGLPFTSGGA